MSQSIKPSFFVRHTKGLLGFAELVSGFYFLIVLLVSGGVLEVVKENKNLTFDIPTTFDFVAFFLLTGIGAFWAAIWWAKERVKKNQPVPVHLIWAIAAVGVSFLFTDPAMGILWSAWGAAISLAGVREDLRRDSGKPRWMWNIASVLIFFGGFIFILWYANLGQGDGDIKASINISQPVLAAILVRLYFFNRYYTAAPLAPAADPIATPTAPIAETSEPETPATDA